ncbi:MAG: lipopolysaccharide heptosyltransferase family protein [Calditrichaeota bacterium]|nr:MAG: lipopolysaccharide heptosyltransferase family protein [Calditrichota bacterium]
MRSADATVKRQRKARRRAWLLKGLTLFAHAPRPMTRHDGPLNDVAILAQEKLGDAILLTPLLRLLKTQFPACRVHVICLGPNAGFFRADPLVDRVYPVKQDYPAYFKAMRHTRFDLLFNTKDHPSFNFLLHTRLIPARVRVGVSHPAQDHFFNAVLETPFHSPIAEKNCALLRFLEPEISLEDCRPHIPVMACRPEIKHGAAELKKAEGIIINLSAGQREREWPLDKWKTLLSTIERPVLVLAMPDKQAEKEELEDSFDHVWPVPPTENIYEAYTLIHAARMLISPDTSLIHVASAGKTAVIGLYRADVEHLRRFGPYGIPFQQVISDTPRVADIAVDAVRDAYRQMEQDT